METITIDKNQATVGQIFKPVPIYIMGCKEEEIKSTIQLSNIYICTDQKFNRFQRWMMRKCFGLMAYEGRFPYGNN